MKDNKKSVDISGNILGDIPGYSLENTTDKQSAREWWHEVLRTYGRYKAYAIFLVLPSDKGALQYLEEFGDELGLISGANCLVIAISTTDFKTSDVSTSTSKRWNLAINEQASNGYSIKIADLLGFALADFPCLVLFQDIRSSEHIKVSLQNMDVKEIAYKVRSVFSVLRKAIKENQNPLKSLEKQRNDDVFVEKGKSIVSGLQNIAGKSLEIVIEALIKATIK